MNKELAKLLVYTSTGNALRIFSIWLSGHPEKRDEFREEPETVISQFLSEMMGEI